MTDILGQALQRITTPQTSIPAEQPPASTLVASSDLVASSGLAFSFVAGILRKILSAIVRLKFFIFIFLDCIFFFQKTFFIFFL